MSRKDDMLRAITKNEELSKRLNIVISSDITISQAQKSESDILVVLAKIIDRYDDVNTTPLYQQVINLLNGKI